MGTLLGSFVQGGFVALALVLTVNADVRADASYANGSPNAVTISRYAADPRWVQGQVIVGAPPAEVWKRLQHVESWPTLLSDIQKLRVIDHQGPEWKIELETKTLDHGMLGYHVHFEDQAQRVKLSATAPGVEVEAFTLVRPGPSPDQASVVYSLFLDTHGFVRLLLPEHSLRQKQEHIVTVTLEDMQRAFGAR